MQRENTEQQTKETLVSSFWHTTGCNPAANVNVLHAV